MTPPPSARPTKVYTAFPKGIQYNVSYESLYVDFKCHQIYYGSYEYALSSSFFRSISQYAYDRPYVFVGAAHRTNIILGAFALISDIKKATPLNTPYLSNGVYWYNTSGYSFGFLDSTDLNQNPYDIGTSSPESRLSWTFDQDGGGGRAGSIMDSSVYSLGRVIYACPEISTFSSSGPPSTTPSGRSAKPSGPSTKPVASPTAPSPATPYPVRDSHD